MLFPKSGSCGSQKAHILPSPRRMVGGARYQLRPFEMWSSETFHNRQAEATHTQRSSSSSRDQYSMDKKMTSRAKWHDNATNYFSYLHIQHNVAGLQPGNTKNSSKWFSLLSGLSSSLGSLSPTPLVETTRAVKTRWWCGVELLT